MLPVWYGVRLLRCACESQNRVRMEMIRLFKRASLIATALMVAVSLQGCVAAVAGAAGAAGGYAAAQHGYKVQSPVTKGR